YVLDHLIVV
nr:Chain 1, Replication and transcription activator [human gammaherpesvirus 4]6NCA_2 Chain 2, Replication and transcription activator [human gammaherpesvirus 4]6NCA_3 Chain 3, Replication and transcription activator [human gammaherpesvirus 4]6NCA_4 Chain 4, Replication and transcription activator [human gammaherpesvirus 4]6NCA_5 Chain 5, Replication and transcription activator [human gammaherpesvirus 4]6NCA_6 Chain 6, Replication and transcription activator [human gammaherpesvirus 4]6NCA_7 Ch